MFVKEKGGEGRKAPPGRKCSGDLEKLHPTDADMHEKLRKQGIEGEVNLIENSIRKSQVRQVKSHSKVSSAEVHIAGGSS